MSPQRLAIIAGVGSGNGASVARRFAKEYIVVLLARKPASYQPVEREVNENGGKALGISTDLSDPGSVRAAFSHIESYRGSISQHCRASCCVQCIWQVCEETIARYHNGRSGWRLQYQRVRPHIGCKD